MLGGLYLLTVAAGYQLDKLELVYSTRGFATGVSYTDQAAQFFAFDALTIVAGLVAALLVGGAFTRWIWPLGAAIAVWFGLSLLLGRVYPEVIQRFTVEPNQYAQEQPYIANNIAMTRLAFDLTNWEDRSYRGDQPLTRADVLKEAATFKNARLWDYRPLQTTLDQLQTVRQYYDFYDVDVDRYVINDETRQVMLSARELAPERNPQAGSWVNQRIVFTHGFGLTMVPVNEVDSQGLPQFFIRDMPPQSASGAPQVTQPRIYFGERPSDWVVVGARQAEFDYPLGSGDGTDGGGTQEETRWTGDTGIRLDSILSRLLFAARFRDLNLLISRPGDGRQPAPHAPEPRRSAGRDRAVPGLRQGPLLGGQRRGPPRLDPGRLHADRSLPERPDVQRLDPRRERAAWPAGSSTTCATASRSSWTRTPAR